MNAGEISVYLSDARCDVTEHAAMTACQHCGNIARPAMEVRMTGIIQVASTDAPREPYMILTTLCTDCWQIWQRDYFTAPHYRDMVIHQHAPASS